MNATKHFFAILAFLISFNVFCQNGTDENNNKIAGVLNNYFDLEREAIHLHTDKTTFLNNESIWYQGYIINRKTNKPYFTTNLFVLLFDEKGKQLSEKLIYATNGTFSGNIKLNSKLESGNYYIQVTTNWMNNFNENESTIIKVNIINPSEGIKNYAKVNLESLELFLHPEGRSLVNEVSNNIGIQVKDCMGNSPENLEASIQNNKGEILKTIKLNKFGYAKFDIIPSESIKVVVKYGDRILEKFLPKPDLIGVSMGVNTFSMDNKTAIKIKTNKQSYDLFQSKKLNLVIHQDQKLTLYPIRFKPEEFEQTMIVNNADLHEGINTIRIIDSDLKQWSERLIYVGTLFKNNINILKNNNRDGKINLVGYSETPNSRLSISVLPEETKSIDENNSIIAGIAINPYLIKPLANSNYYLNSPNRSKLYELDLALINQEESKYSWEYMKVNTPTSHYSFDIGLSLKGKIDSAIKDKTSHKVKLVAYKDRIMVSTDVSENGDYLFEHLLLTDSSLVKLSLEKLPNFQKVASNLSPKVLNRKWVFNKLITDYIGQVCANPIPYEVSMFDLPKFNGAIINLDEVVIKKKASALTRSNVLSNSMLKGYKIDDTNNHGSLLNFIAMHGFVVSRNMGDVTITVRQRMSLNSANPSPVVYIDDRVLFSSFFELDVMQMSEIDEIYLDSNKIGASVNNNIGIIKIYTKKPQNNFFNKPDPNSFLVKEAYTPNYLFQNSDYQNTQSKGFDNFGLIGWSPRLITDDNGQFIFDLTDYNKAKAKIIIEGMTPDGKLFQEEKIIDLK